MSRSGNYRTSRRFGELAALDARLASTLWGLRLEHSETLDRALRFRLSCQCRRVAGLRVLVEERLQEILGVHG